MNIRNFALVLILIFVTQSGIAQIQTNSEVESRVDSILSKMTLDEKLEIIGGINDFFTRSNPRLGIPSLKMSDGPMGVHDYGLTTAYPAGIALALRGTATLPTGWAFPWAKTRAHAAFTSFSGPA